MTAGPRSDGRKPESGAAPAVPRLPRSRGVKFSRPQLVRIVGLAALLVFLLVTQRTCANAVSGFVTGFSDHGAAAPPSLALPRPGAIDEPTPGPGSAGSAGSTDGTEVGGYERLRPGMTDAEIKAAIERAKARAGSGSAAR